VKRTTTEDGRVVYNATGWVKDEGNGEVPTIAPYPNPISLGDWYPNVTHINGMQVTPMSGISSAAALQDMVNKEVDGQVALCHQEAVDLLYTYSAQLGNVVVDTVDCIEGKLGIKDKSTLMQAEIIMDAVRRQQRVTLSAHSRGTIKTDNAVRDAHARLKDEILTDIRKEHDLDMGIPGDVLAELSFSGLADKEAEEQMNKYTHLVYAGNAVAHPSDVVDITLLVGGLDLVSMPFGTYSETGRKIDAAIGTGGSKNSKLNSVGKSKGHGFDDNYMRDVSKEIAEDLNKR
jgi:hypothetical protein